MLPVVLSIVEHSQYDVLHESVCLVLGHLEDELGKVDGVGLEEIEQVLIVLG